MIGQKIYSSDFGSSFPFSRSCWTSAGMPLSVALLDIDPSELFFKKCADNHVREVSLFSDDGSGRRYGDYVVRFESDLFKNAVDALCDYWELLVDRYAVDRRQIELFDCEGVLFLQVDARAFCHEHGHKKLYLIYVEMNRLLMQNISIHACDITAISKLNPSVRYTPLFSNEWHNKKDLMDALDPSVDASHLFYDHSSDIPLNWIEYYHRHRPEPPKKMSFLRKVYLRSKCSVEHGVKPIYKALGNLKRCALLQDIASTTSWEDENELSFLGGVCNALNLRSFRRLCVCAGVSNPKMREADYASSWLTHDLRRKHCEELADKFHYNCPTDCGVTTPIAFPFLPTDSAGPSSLFFTDGKYVYYTVDGVNDSGERVCSFFEAIQSLQDEFGEYWGYTMTPDQGRTFIPIKVSGESKKAILSSLEKAGIKIFKRDLTYQFALSVEDLGAMASRQPVTTQGRSYAGWTEGLGGLAYSFPYRQYAESPAVPFLHGAAYKSRFGKFGTFENWLQTLKEQTLPDVMLLALAGAFAGPLLRLVNSPSFALHFWGGSSEYKKRLLQLAGAVWGKPHFAYSYTSLLTNLGEVAAAHNDSLIAVNFNESVSHTRARNLLQNLLSGSSQDGSYGESLRCVVISTGERPIETKDERRLILNFELPKEEGAPLDRGCRFEDNYGYAGPLLVSRFLNEPPGKELRSMLARIMDALPVQTVESSVRRVFAVLNVSLAQASQALGFPLAISTIVNSFERLLVSWAKNRDQVEQEAVDSVIGFMAGSSNSARIGDSEMSRKDVGYDGYRFVGARQKGVLFPTKKFKALFCDTVVPKRLAEMLHADGLLVSGKDGGLSSPRWVPGLKKSVRGYFVRWPRRS